MTDQPESPMGCRVGKCENVFLNSPIEISNIVAKFFSSAEECFHDWLLVTFRGHFQVPALPVVLLLLLHLPHKILGLLEEWQDVFVTPALQTHLFPLIIVPGRLEHYQQTSRKVSKKRNLALPLT